MQEPGHGAAVSSASMSNALGRLGCVVALALAAASPAAGGGATYYVSPSGNDANPCTSSLPCREIREPLTFVTAGDTILVADGSYKGFDVEDVHGGFGAPITIQAQGTGAQVTADAIADAIAQCSCLT